MLQPIIIQCIKCGSPYKVYPKFKYCQCEKCPWVMVENSPYTYGVIRKNIETPISRMTKELYEEISPGNYRVVRDEESKKKKKKRRFTRKLESQMFNFSHIVAEENEKKLKKTNAANIV